METERSLLKEIRSSLVMVFIALAATAGAFLFGGEDTVSTGIATLAFGAVGAFSAYRSVSKLIEWQDYPKRYPPE